MFGLLIALGLAVAPPEPWGAIPTAGQLQYHREELSAFIHYGVNTFREREWGDGREDPDRDFQPTDLDCDQWVRVLKDAGFKRIIMIGRHHDGFCLWKSNFTSFDVNSSTTFQERSVELNQSGDVFIELSKACSKYDMGMGLYLSPWDANSEYYGDEQAYNQYYMDQLKEVLGNSSYGNNGRFVEVWMDGAKGDDVDQKYWFDQWFALIEELQPGAVVFSPYGSTVRWIGNEQGKAGYPCWSKLDKMRQRNWYDKYGGDEAEYLQVGDPNGDIWSVGECDVSITGGWFWKRSGREPKSMAELTDIYFKSVGRGQPWLLNVPPDNVGRIPDSYVERLQELSTTIKRTFETNLAFQPGVEARASSERGPEYSASNVLDGSTETYWTMDDDQLTGWLEIHFGEMKSFDIISISEHIPLGQRIHNFTVDIHTASGWMEHSEEQTIGAKRLIRSTLVSADAIRFNITVSDAVPVIESVGVFMASGDFAMGDGFPEGLTNIDYKSLNKVGDWSEQESSYVSTAAGNSLSTTVDASKFWVLGTLDPDFGNMKVYIDDELVDTVSLKHSSHLGRQKIYSSPDLTPGRHSFKVEAADSKPIGVRSFYYVNNNGAGMFEFASADYNVQKGGSVTLKVKRVAGNSGEASVTFETTPNTAVHGRHYEDKTATLTFGDGESEKTVTVKTIDHHEVVGNLTFYGKISSPSNNALVGFNQSTIITIYTPVPTPTPTSKPTSKPTSGPTTKPTTGPTAEPTPEPAQSGGGINKMALGVSLTVLILVIVGGGVIACLVIRSRRRKRLESETSTRMALI